MFFRADCSFYGPKYLKAHTLCLSWITTCCLWQTFFFFSPISWHKVQLKKKKYKRVPGRWAESADFLRVSADAVTRLASPLPGPVGRKVCHLWNCSQPLLTLMLTGSLCAETVAHVDKDTWARALEHFGRSIQPLSKAWPWKSLGSPCMA